MCLVQPRVENSTPAAAPPPPQATAERFRIQERPRTQDGRVGRNTARTRRTFRSDLKISSRSGANVARVG